MVTTNRKNSELIAPNLLKRDFSASRPNEVWVTDVTAIWIWEGWVYPAAHHRLFRSTRGRLGRQRHADQTIAASCFRRSLDTQGLTAPA